MISGFALVADRSLGRLARWLRLLGADTAYDPVMEDERLLRLAREGRIVVTRTRAVAAAVAKKIAPEKMVWVTKNDPLEQLAEVALRLKLTLDPKAVFTRCLACNQEVIRIARSSVCGRVPEYVHQTAEAFSECPGCGRIFWRATHRQRALTLAEKILKGA